MCLSIIQAGHLNTKWHHEAMLFLLIAMELSTLTSSCFIIRTIKMLKPKFSYKIFNRSGILIGNLPIDRVKSEPKFSEAINGGQGNMTILLAGDVLDSPVSV